MRYRRGFRCGITSTPGAVGVSQVAERTSARSRSAQRSSTSSMPTDSRSSDSARRARLAWVPASALDERLHPAEALFGEPERRHGGEAIGGGRRPRTSIASIAPLPG